MKEHWSKAPAHARQAIEQIARTMVMLPSANGTITWPSPAATYIATLEAACSRELAYDAPKTPQSDALAALEQGDDRIAIVRFRQQNSIELERETMAKTRWLALAKWRESPSSTELAATARGVREAAAAEAAIERRTSEILAGEESARRTRARQQAETELAK